MTTATQEHTQPSDWELCVEITGAFGSGTGHRVFQALDAIEQGYDEDAERGKEVCRELLARMARMVGTNLLVPQVRKQVADRLCAAIKST